MSATPRTDAVAFNARDGECVWAGDMRKLELDLASAEQRIAALQGDAEMVMVPSSTVNDLLSVRPDKCPAKIREALYELASFAAQTAATDPL